MTSFETSTPLAKISTNQSDAIMREEVKVEICLSVDSTAVRVEFFEPFKENSYPLNWPNKGSLVNRSSPLTADEVHSYSRQTNSFRTHPFDSSFSSSASLGYPCNHSYPVSCRRSNIRLLSGGRLFRCLTRFSCWAQLPPTVSRNNLTTSLGTALTLFTKSKSLAAFYSLLLQSTVVCDILHGP